VKRSVVALMTMTMVLAVAGPAAAKGAVPQSAQMTGPGLGSPMTFGDPTAPGGTSADANVILLTNESHFLQTVYDGSQIGAPRQASLGPQYTIIWTLRKELHPGHTFQVRSDLYPYAQGRAVMYTHGGQKVGDMGRRFVLRSGWAAANPVLVDNLQGWGMPKEHRHVAGKVASSAIAPVWAVVAALVAMILVALVKSRRRNARTPSG
jgi:hypothetical protein